MQLYGFGPTRSLRALWALRELEIEFEFIEVDLMAGAHLTPEFLRLNPAGAVPVLVDGEIVLSESAAIVLYLAEKYPHGGLLPTDLAQRAQLYRWILFAVTELEEPLWRIARHQSLYPEAKRSPAEIEVAKEDFFDMARVLESHMTGRDFIVGDRLSAADCVTVYLTDWADTAELLGGFPQLQRYLERMYARPKAPPRIASQLAKLGVA